MIIVMTKGEEPLIEILLLEQDPNTISVASLCLSEIKECRLHLPGESFENLNPDIILFADGLKEENSLKTLAEYHHSHPLAYLIVSLAENRRHLIPAYMQAGAIDCVLKNSHYVSNLIRSVKRALIRISEREAFSLPVLYRAAQIAMDENLPDVVFVLDISGRLLHANKAILNLLGYSLADLIHSSFARLLGEEDALRFEQYLRNVTQEGSFRDTVMVRCSDGSFIELEMNCACTEDHRIYGVLRQVITDESVEVTLNMLKQDTAGNEMAFPSVIGPYRVITLLGAGSMGRVYQGFDEQLERYVAIKVISGALHDDPAYLERFQSEARLLASISHPNIALVYYFGNLEGLPFYCMEYLPGGSLEALLNKVKKLDPYTAALYTEQVALGLDHAWKKGIVHRDIKPSNLMLAENNRIKIVDFGLARKIQETEGGSISMAGTPCYIAPEQIQAGLFDIRSDIYSLGVTLFRMVYGRFPYTGNVPEVFQKQVSGRFPAWNELDPSVPESLYRILSRMMDKDPSQRYQNYQQLLIDLRAFIRPETAIPVTLAAAEAATGVFHGHLENIRVPEILGKITSENLSGKLTLTWMDLCKHIYLQDGKIVAVLSNQEGESFVDVLLKTGQLSGKEARKLQSNSFDLFSAYSSAIKSVDRNSIFKIGGELEALAEQILQGVFGWTTGEYIFESGPYSGAFYLDIPAVSILKKGIQEWLDADFIRSRLRSGQCSIHKAMDISRILSGMNLSPADTFVLFRFENEINYTELFNLSGLSEQEFARLIYFFYCSRLVELQELQEKKKQQPQPKPKPAVQQKEDREPEESAIEARPMSKEEFFQHYQRLALESFRRRNFWATVEYCKKALEIRKDISVLHLMGNALATHPRFRAEALKAYNEALKIDPENPVILRDLGDLYFAGGSYQLAAARYRDVLKYDPEDKHCCKRLEEIAHKLQKRTKRI